jgi:hypothetical protein
MRIGGRVLAFEVGDEGGGRKGGRREAISQEGLMGCWVRKGYGILVSMGWFCEWFWGGGGERGTRAGYILRNQ